MQCDMNIKEKRTGLNRYSVKTRALYDEWLEVEKLRRHLQGFILSTKRR